MGGLVLYFVNGLVLPKKKGRGVGKGGIWLLVTGA